MNITITKRIILMTAGAVIGGVTGYLVTDLLIYKLHLDSSVAEEEPDDEKDQPVDVTITNSGEWIPTDYASFGKREKESLEKLASKYTVDLNHHVISITEYENSLPSFTNQTLTYYEDDKTFCDESEVMIDAPEILVGSDVYSLFGKESEDPDVVYIRNERLQTDFEVIRVHGSYAVSVMGLSIEEFNEKQGNSKKKGRKKRSPNEDSEDKE